MKPFTTLLTKLKEKPRLCFWGNVLMFYVCILALVLYFLFADLSTAPAFIYSQF